MEYKYLVSIVIAIYNSEPWLRETLDSVLNQDVKKFGIPYERIVQVIMVDDGSTDGTDKIIDEYAAVHTNFFAVHKENGGVASARNEGLKYVEGKYMNFLDSDDKFSSNVLWGMYSFFEQHYDETDVVTMPIYFFDAQQGEHWQNGKFKDGCRIINLFRNYDATLVSTCASLFKSVYKDKVLFDSDLVCGEDIKYIYTILSEKSTLGVTNRCKYFYRRRSSGEQSLVRSSPNKVGWYFDYFTHLIDWGTDFFLNKFGFLPKYIQSMFVKDLGWRFKENHETAALSVLNEQEFEQYKEVLFKSLKYFDDDIILSQKHIFVEHKVFMLSKKYGRLPNLVECNNDIGLIFDKKPICWISDLSTYVDFMQINGNRLTIEGYAMLCGFSDDEPVEIKLIVKKNDSFISIIPCDIVEKRNVNQYRLNETLFRGIPFIGEIVMEKKDVKAEIALAVIIRGNTIVKTNIRYKRFSPVGKEYKNDYYFKDDYMLTLGRHYIYFERCGIIKKKIREKNYMNELKKSKNESDRKAFKAITAYKILKKIKRKPIWLISDRINKADDNGEAFFRYLCETKPNNANVYFIISEDCPDYERLKQIGKVVPYFSHKHKLLHLLADVIISAHAEEYVINPFQKFSAPYRSFISTQKYVFLQHGIIKDDLSPWLNRYSKPLNGFVTSANKERNSILECNYSYNENEVWLTGLPRYDYLYNDPQKYITVMPTWRASLSDNAAQLKKSEFYNFYTEFFSNERLISAAKEYGYKICAKLHPRMEEVFDFSSKDILRFDANDRYRDIFAKSAMMITDFSSVAFDFAYLKKPLIYAQFDAETFYEGQVYDQGYFDYERDGFGEVTYDLDSTVDLIIDYMKNGCQLKDKYRERIDSFYAFHDKNNCQRVYEKIMELLEDK